MEISKLVDSGLNNVKNIIQLQEIFRQEPYGGTPINRALQRILYEKASFIKEEKLLIIMPDSFSKDSSLDLLEKLL